MAKLSVTILFLFFTLSLARTPLTEPENDVTHLKLPSENDVIRTEHHVPLTLVRFRPINRRFRLQSNLPFRLCRHHRNPVFKHQIPYGNNDMILSSKKNNIDFDKFVYRIGVQQIPSDRFNFHHQRHHYDDHKEKKIWKFLEDREMLRKMKLKDQSPHHHHHHDDDEEDGDREQKREDQGGELNQEFSLNQFHAHHVDDDEDDKMSKLYAKHYGEDHYSFDRMKLRKRFHYNNGEAEEEKAKKENKWHKKEEKKGGFMRSVRKFLHNYFD
ncbi:uncharacterized protein LOC132060073 isoform X1 [Lycium ferocissimum]|uniref:uncharacterized protein LOC132060073 isoform X1 n=1 Tax=Lycium ferocissimum TaxID=112874 RepID=UPI002815AA6D|nr:uncharacterized protein LOC132060073 isoform X1 [Lycium ferocissimum]